MYYKRNNYIIVRVTFARVVIERRQSESKETERKTRLLFCLFCLSVLMVCSKMLDRVHNIQKNAVGDGINQCVLCGDCPSIWSGSVHVTCKDCEKVSLIVYTQVHHMCWRGSFAFT